MTEIDIHVQNANKEALKKAALIARIHDTTLSVLVDGKVVELSPDDFEKLLDSDKAQ